MKSHLFPALKLTFLCLVFFAGVYPFTVWAVAQFAPNNGKGETVEHQGRLVGFARVGQNFTDDRYFCSRPSAVGYNAAGSGGSNKGPTNPDYLATVQARMDTFLVHNPAIAKSQIPAELVTASGSGLDPHLSPAGALVQVPRIARLRNIPEETLRDLVAKSTETPMFGTSTVHLLRLNIALDQLR